MSVAAGGRRARARPRRARWPAAAAAASGGDQLAQGRHEMTLARAKVVRRARRRQGGRPRPRLPPGPHRLPRPLRVRRGPAAPAQPEPRARHGVHVRRAAQPDPRRRVRRRRPRRRTVDAARRAARRRPRAGRQGRRRAGARVRLLVHDPLPRGRRGRAADRDPARLAGRRAAPQGYKRPLGARRARRGRRDGDHVGARDASCSTSRRSTASCWRRSPRCSRSWC